MADSKALTNQQIQHALKKAAGWRLVDGALRKTVKLSGFRAAIEFVEKVAAVAEELDHHPDIDIRFDAVTLTLKSHDIDGISERDLELAEAIEARVD